ncbi:LysR family transcriptional regulator [Corynebacterium atypicum]|uniref:LysR family transcriptional regulator n=2 Tax=Corynebacterium atypicum TaxID=191610 RepID=A0ABN4DGV9_9CORY|nr:LysR family transcriptional regulator [Corynebacterium atypicum]
MADASLTDVESFIAVARAVADERATLSDAADELGVPQSTLSRRIARVERRAGAPLFDRAGRGLKLNARGRAYLPRAQLAVQSLAAGAAEVRRLMDPERGTVRLDFMHSLGTWLVPELLRTYRARHPRVEVVLHQAAALNLVDRVLVGSADLALVGPASQGDAASQVHWHPLRTQRLALAVPADHRLAAAEKAPIALAAARDEPFIGMLPGYGTRILLDRLAEQAGFRPRLVFESMELTTVMGLVSAGLGVALLPLDDPYLAPTGIVLRPLDPPALREIGLVWNDAAHSAPPVDQLRRFILSTAGMPGVFPG